MPVHQGLSVQLAHFACDPVCGSCSQELEKSRAVSRPPWLLHRALVGKLGFGTRKEWTS